MKLLLALVASTLFAPVGMPDAGVCVEPGALACAVLAPTDGAVRVQSEAPARYVIEGQDGAPLAQGEVTGALVPLPPGAARLVVRSA